MKLRTVVLVSMLTLMAIYALVMFWVPRRLVRNDIFATTEKIRHLEEAQDRQDLTNQEILLSDIFQQKAQNINSFLFMIYGRPLLQGLLTFPKESDPPKAYSEKLQENWRILALLASYNPSYGFLQLDSLDGKQNATLTPAEANLYDVKTAFLPNPLVLAVTLENNTKYLGVPFQTSEDTENSYLILFPWQDNPEKIQQLVNSVNTISSGFVVPKALDEAQIFTDPTIANEQAVNWANKLKMIQALIPFVFDDHLRETHQTPPGVVLLRQDEPPIAILTQEVMSTKALTPAQDFYALHQPPASAPSIANDTFLIANPTLKHLFVANIVKTNTFYFTLGTPIDSLAEQLALWTNKTILVRVGDKVWLGFDKNGARYSQGKMTQFTQAAQSSDNSALLQLEDNTGYLLKEQSGTLQLGTKTYKFFNISTLLNGEIGFYEIVDVTEPSLADFAMNSGQQLAQKISLQLYILSLIMGAIIFLVLATLSTFITVRPVRALALATETVAGGDYSHVKLPSMGGRKDEVAVLVRSFGNMLEALQEKEKIRSVLNKVVSKQIAEEILKSDIQLGGEDRYITVLFADIRHFTQITRQMTSQQTITMLNSIMTKLTHIIEGEGGVVDKYIGDEVMAIFGAPQKNERHAMNAVSAAILMIHAMKKWNERHTSQGEPAIDIGIGVHSGMVAAGNMGAADRLNYTVLGTNVNLAARLCQAAAPTQILISAQTLQEPGVQDAFEVTPLPPIEVKGFDHPVSIYQTSNFKWKNTSEVNKKDLA